MTGNLIVSRFRSFQDRLGAVFQPNCVHPLNLHTGWLYPDRLPKVASGTPAISRILDLLGPLDWDHFPERDLQRHWCQPAISYAAFAGAMLI